MIIFLPVLLALIFKTFTSVLSWLLKKLYLWYNMVYVWSIDLTDALIYLYCCAIALIVLGN